MEISELLDRWWWKQRIVDNVVQPIHSLYYNANGINLMDQDWDNLIILDACRADLFEAVAPVDTYTEYRREQSVGSFTGEWARNTFGTQSFGDTVYVTANPYSSSIAGEQFHEIMEVWHDAFDDDLQTVPARKVASATLDAFDRHPDKRLIAHFMQPHHPFVTDDDLHNKTEWTIQKAASDGLIGDRPHDPFEAVEMGLASKDRVWRAYRENLEYAMSAVDSLLENLPGRTVITSDHGNLNGERAWPIPIRLYGHPEGIRTPELVTVPYAVADGSRRQVSDEGVQSQSDATENEVQERLQDLGYV